MAWYYTERPQRRPLDAPAGRTNGGGGGGPPSGPAGGDLSGSYPNPELRALAVGTPELADGAVTDAKVTSVAYGKVTGAPTSLPPSGSASGDLGGTYPAPTIAAGAVTTTKLGDAPNGVTTAKLNDGAVTNAKIADVAWSKVTGAPTAFPPSGSASGDLSGSYPGPTVVKVNGAALGTTTPLARGDILVADGTPALKRLALGAASTVLQSDGSDVVWGTSLGGPPSGPAGGDLSGTYPNPTVTAAAKSKWQVSGATLTPTDATKTVAVPGVNAGAIQWGTTTGKGRLLHYPSLPTSYWTENTYLNAGTTAWLSDDGTKPSWIASLDANGDQFNIARAPANSPNALTTLLAVGNAGSLTLAGPTMQCGTGTAKARLNSTVTEVTLSLNRKATDNSQDDATKPLLSLALDNGTDRLTLDRRAAGNGAWSMPLLVSGAGDLTILGPTATKATGTTWANPSDRRLKKNIVPYVTGLEAVQQLAPVGFQFNGKGGSQDGVQGYGFLADEVESVMPEMVGSRRGKLEDADEEETDIQTLDSSNVTLALVNAVKELAATVQALTERVAALERAR